MNHKEYLKVKDKDNLLRDSFSNAIVNSDEDGYQRYIENYKKVYNQNKKINDFENDLKTMKDDIDEIKSLLRSLIK